MKKTLLISLLSLAGTLAYGQGTVQFLTIGANVNTPTWIVNFKEGSSLVASNMEAVSGSVKTWKTTTLDGFHGFKPAGSTASGVDPVFNIPNGTAFNVALYGGSSADNLALIKKAGFLTAANAGFVLSSSGGGTFGVPGVANNSPAVVQLRGWTGNYASYEEFWAAANASGVAPGFGYAGQTELLNVTTGGGTVTPPFLTGLDPLFLYPVPEPSVIGLGLLGLAGLIFIRRRK